MEGGDCIQQQHTIGLEPASALSADSRTKSAILKIQDTLDRGNLLGTVSLYPAEMMWQAYTDLRAWQKLPEWSTANDEMLKKSVGTLFRKLHRQLEHHKNPQKLVE